MKVTRYRTEQERERIAAHIGAWDETKTWLSTPRMRREVTYLIEDDEFKADIRRVLESH